MSPRKIDRNIGISRILLRRLVKRRKINQLKRMKTPHMNNETRDRRTIKSGNLAECFDRNPKLVENLLIKMKKTLRLKHRQTFKLTEFILKERNTRYQTRIFSIKKISSP